jgi:hypothetical protein
MVNLLDVILKQSFVCILGLTLPMDLSNSTRHNRSELGDGNGLNEMKCNAPDGHDLWKKRIDFFTIFHCLYIFTFFQITYISGICHFLDICIFFPSLLCAMWMDVILFLFANFFGQIS